MREITKIQKAKADRCSFAGCEISSGDDVYFVTLGKKKLPFCHDCATKLGELFDVKITGDEMSEFGWLDK
jgi:ribosomal protein L24E